MKVEIKVVVRDLANVDARLENGDLTDILGAVLECRRMLNMRNMMGNTYFTQIPADQDFETYLRSRTHWVTDLRFYGSALWAEIEFLPTQQGAAAMQRLNGLVAMLKVARHAIYQGMVRRCTIVTVDLHSCHLCEGRGEIVGIGDRRIPCDGPHSWRNVPLVPLP
jgi:hypothetical protein